MVKYCIVSSEDQERLTRISVSHAATSAIAHPSTARPLPLPFRRSVSALTVAQDASTDLTRAFHAVSFLLSVAF